MTQPAAASDDGHGQRVYWIEGAEYPSASTVVQVLDNAGLNTWKQKKIARWVAEDEELAELARNNQEYQAVKEALNRDQTAASLGDTIHKLTEDDDRGLLDDLSKIDRNLVGYIEQWRRAKREHSIEILHIERTIFNAEWGYAGTFDRIGRIPALRDVPLILDIKTGKAVYPEHAMQMAGYAHGDAMWDPERFAREPMPPDLCVDVAVAVHLAEDDYELVPLALERAWAGLRACVIAWKWQHREAKQAIGRPLPIPPQPAIAGVDSDWSPW